MPSATLTEGSALALRSSGVISNPNLQANLTARRSRSGSSCRVINAGRGVLIIPAYVIDVECYSMSSMHLLHDVICYHASLCPDTVLYNMSPYTFFSSFIMCFLSLIMGFIYCGFLSPSHYLL